MRKLHLLLSAALLAFTAAQAAAQGVLRIGLVEDPDTLDPTLNRLATGRQPLTALCDKLFDVKPGDLALTPQLATGYEVAKDGRSVTVKLRTGVKFHDGETFDAAALAFNIKRHMTLPGSLRRTELSMVDHVDVVDPSDVRFVLNAPQANLLLYSLAERAGMMVAPQAAQQLGDRFGSQPVCAGEYRFVERVPQGRIVVEKFAGYWDAAHTAGDPDRIEYLPIGDSTVRLSSLRSGQIQIAERLTPTDLPQLARDPRVKVVSAPDLGYHYIRYNSGNGPRAAIFRDVRVRHAVDLAIDRRVLVKALFNDQYQPGNQFVGPSSPYYDPAHPVPARDVAASRRLLQQAGVAHLTFTLLVPPERERQEAAQMIQAMLAEAGITMKIETQEDAVMLQRARRGDFDAIFNFWSGRPHPDGNLYAQYSCNGPTNDSKFCDPAVDQVMVAAREATTDKERQRLYREVNAMLVQDYPSSVLWHRRTFTGVSAKLSGFMPHPDSTIRVKGLHLQP
ncbi:extracellular solute-binding protein [Caballeronia sordidicola]|uniref:Extracellular solute-binding protein n=1 Tax=Caballeronia sordidicola TaxID=196367 RepID=A0A158I6X1_CABSO|nr:ABC transporter substrate-binding protein [Caballeronia sordidicola]SAL52324.1 extracellular solute-binding protein [Caballeronia sordidicola]